MINANELRIGNLLMNYSKISFEEVNGRLIFDMTDAPFVCKSWFPIPLTENWLLKLGFTRQHEDYFNDVIYIKNVVNNTEFVWGVYPNELGSGIVIKNSPQLKYVHQLQNLFYALTGEELTVKETSVST